MREMFAEVLRLQLEFSSQNTPQMARRGDLIRNLIPGEMREWRAAKGAALLPYRGRLNVQGRDGTGLKTFVPWVRIHSPELSPSAQSGWYVVYLFRADGAGVSLAISHGSTRFDGREFKPRSAAEASVLMAWGRGLVKTQANRSGFQDGIDLGSAEMLSKAYERTTAFSKFYTADALPSDTDLQADAETAVGFLGELYRAIELGRSPDVDPPEVAAAKAILSELAAPAKEQAQTGALGQRFGLTAEERRLVENHAMLKASDWLATQGYTDIKDVHATHSCDYKASHSGIEYYIEVKGTTAGLGQVLLTANEVELHREQHPNNILIVVYNIDLVEMRKGVAGGIVHPIVEWDINTASLQPLSYVCRLNC